MDEVWREVRVHLLGVQLVQKPGHGWSDLAPPSDWLSSKPFFPLVPKLPPYATLFLVLQCAKLSAVLYYKGMLYTLASIVSFTDTLSCRLWAEQPFLTNQASGLISLPETKGPTSHPA